MTLPIVMLAFHMLLTSINAARYRGTRILVATPEGRLIALLIAALDVTAFGELILSR